MKISCSGTILIKGDLKILKIVRRDHQTDLDKYYAMGSKHVIKEDGMHEATTCKNTISRNTIGLSESVIIHLPLFDRCETK